MIDTQSLREITDKAVNANTARIRTTFLAEVLAYSVENGVPVVDVQPIVKGRDNLGGNFTRAPITGIPYYPPSAGAFIIYAPLQVGDIVECGVFERSSEEYVANSSKDYIPSNPRRHHESDSFVRTKVRSKVESVSTDVVQASALVIALADGSCRFSISASGQIVLHSGDIRLGDDTASAAVALNPAVLSQLQSIALSLAPIVAWFNAGVTAATVIGSPQPALFPIGAPAALAPVYTASLVGATKVKAK